jgi:hypothetical protein
MTAPPLRLLVVTLAAMAAAPGCAWVDSLRGDGFQAWNQSLSNGGLRGDDPAAKPSGFFTDSRSEEIEKSLGGGF